MKILFTISHFAGRTFAIWVIVFALLGFAFPAEFSKIGPYIPFLLGIIMFGMGLTLSAEDFKELLIPFNKDLKYINHASSEIYNRQREELELDNFNLLYVILVYIFCYFFF